MSAGGQRVWQWARTRVMAVSCLLACLLPAGEFVGLAPCLQAEGAAAAVTAEQLKAAFFVNVVAYCEWPEASFKDAESPLVIGVYGADPFGNALEVLTRKKSSGGRRIEWRKVQSDDDALQCHAVYFPTVTGMPEATDPKGILARCRAKSVLTVGDGEPFLAAGGIVGLQPQPVAAGRSATLGLLIDRARVEEAKLRMSSKLLDLARRSVRPNSRLTDDGATATARNP